MPPSPDFTKLNHAEKDALIAALMARLVAADARIAEQDARIAIQDARIPALEERPGEQTHPHKNPGDRPTPPPRGQQEAQPQAPRSSPDP